LNERLSFTLGASAYNILNHPNVANPDSDMSKTMFGAIINTAHVAHGAFAAAATDARIVQVMGKINF